MQDGRGIKALNWECTYNQVLQTSHALKLLSKHMEEQNRFSRLSHILMLNLFLLLYIFFIYTIAICIHSFYLPDLLTDFCHQHCRLITPVGTKPPQ